MSHTADNENKIRVGVSIGDLNGIGPEVVIKTFEDSRMTQLCTPILYCASKTISFYRKQFGTPELNINVLRRIEDASPKKINIFQVWEDDVNITPGTPTEISGKYAVRSLQAAIKDLQVGNIDVLVTAPVDKSNISIPDFDFKGHTEYLAAEFPSDGHLMFMVSEFVKVAVVSGHVPLKNAAADLTTEKITKKLKIMHQSLISDFGIRKPRIAVLGLNPHAGDKGLLGKEEEEIIIPAIKKVFENHMLVYGPYAADGFFGNSAFSQFDAVLAMYHDQGLIPFKTMSMDMGVNFTAGLPIVRTSPTHGTAFDIAGKGVASESSFRQAVYVACDIFRSRNNYKEINENPLAYARLRSDR